MFNTGILEEKLLEVALFRGQNRVISCFLLFQLIEVLKGMHCTPITTHLNERTLCTKIEPGLKIFNFTNKLRYNCCLYLNFIVALLGRDFLV